MKTFEECKEYIAVNKYGWKSYKDYEQVGFNELGISCMSGIMEEVSKLYAKQVATQALIDASENVIAGISIYNTTYDEISGIILDTPIKTL